MELSHKSTKAQNKLSFRASAHTGVGISWIIRAFLVYPGDCHTSDVGHWFAMTAFFILSALNETVPYIFDYLRENFAA